MFGAVAAIATCMLAAAFTGGAEGGTRFANNMEPYALDYIREHGLLEPGESIVAYNDASLSLDGSEAALLTDRRIVYHFHGQTTALALADVERVEHIDQGVLGEAIDVFGVGGEQVRIEIAPFNGGMDFLRALERQRGVR